MSKPSVKRKICLEGGTGLHHQAASREAIMKMKIRLGGSTRVALIAKKCEDVLLESLHCFQHHVKQVYLHIEDIFDPSGGTTKQCRCVLHLRRMPPIVIRDKDECVQALVNRVADRATHTLRQKVCRGKKRILRSRKPQTTVSTDQTIPRMEPISH